MSVTLINNFEVPAGDEDEFIAAWEKSRDYLKDVLSKYDPHRKRES